MRKVVAALAVALAPCAALVSAATAHAHAELVESSPLDGEMVTALPAIVELTLRGSRRRPLVLVAEDVHWIDTASEAFLALLVERMAGAPVLLLITYRPGYRPPGAERSYATQLALSPLSQEDSLSVVQAMAEQLPRPVAGLILARAEGNPFFLEELTRGLVDEGALARQNGKMVATRALESIEIPATIQELIAARLDRLRPDGKRVAQVASVLGRQFSRDVLAGLLAGDHGGPERQADRGESAAAE